MNDDYKVSDELRDKLDEENARFVLSRAHWVRHLNCVIGFISLGA